MTIASIIHSCHKSNVEVSSSFRFKALVIHNRVRNFKDFFFLKTALKFLYSFDVFFFT